MAEQAYSIRWPSKYAHKNTHAQTNMYAVYISLRLVRGRALSLYMCTSSTIIHAKVGKHAMAFQYVTVEYVTVEHARNGVKIFALKDNESFLSKKIKIMIAAAWGSSRTGRSRIHWHIL